MATNRLILDVPIRSLINALSIYIYIYIYIYLSVCLSICLSICLSVYLSICLSVYLSVCLSGWLSVCLSVYDLTVYLSTYLFIEYKIMSAFHENWLQSVCVCIGTRLRDCIIITPRISLDILKTCWPGHARFHMMLDSMSKSKYTVKKNAVHNWGVTFLTLSNMVHLRETAMSLSWEHIIYPIYHHLDTTMSTKQIIPVCTPTWGTVLEKNWSKIMTPNLWERF